jgi:serine/threonine protein phosphatase PrpC
MSAYETAARSHVGCVRRVNEDAVFASGETGVWAVADGMGGHALGEQASQAVVEALASVPAGLDAERAALQIRDSLAGVNAALVAQGKSLSPARTIGATVVALALDGRRFACLWAGDSRAYRVRRGVISLLTRDHTMVQQLADRGLIPEAEIANHPDSHVVMRAIGAHATTELDSVHGDVVVGDVFLLCSDGLSRLLSSDELQAAVAVEEPDSAAGALLQAALDRGAPDNVSLVVVRVRGD